MAFNAAGPAGPGFGSIANIPSGGAPSAFPSAPPMQSPQVPQGLGNMVGQGLGGLAGVNLQPPQLANMSTPQPYRAPLPLPPPAAAPAPPAPPAPVGPAPPTPPQVMAMQQQASNGQGGITPQMAAAGINSMAQALALRNQMNQGITPQPAPSAQGQQPSLFGLGGLGGGGGY
jgi:hypothetical protein